MLRVVVHKVAKGRKLEPIESWVYRIYQNRGWNKACVALANKNSRIAWALASSDQAYDAKKAAIPLKKQVA